MLLISPSRKEIIGVFADQLVDRLLSLPPSSWSDIFTTLHEAFDIKEIAFVSYDEPTQAAIEDANWGGRIQPEGADDYFMLVDANLGGYKSDPVVERNIKYSLLPTRNGYQARVDVSYKHTGFYDWKTTTYRDYVRLFVPPGATFVSAEGIFPDPRGLAYGVNVEQDLGFTSLGGYFSVDPQKSHSISFTYLLPASVTEAIESGTYRLQVFKQMGADPHNFSLDLDLGNSVTYAVPGEDPSNFGDDEYTLQTEIIEDQDFVVRVETD